VTQSQWIVCGVGVAAGLGGSALFSGIETGIYSLNRVRLHVFAHAHRAGAATLERLLRTPNRMLAALLVGNNIFNYVISIALGAMLEAWGYRGWSQVGVNTLLLMPMLLIFGEIVPKDLFRAHADRLVYSFARPLAAWQGLLVACGLVPLIDVISRRFERAGGEHLPMHLMHPRRLVTALIREGVGQGVISAYQSDMLDRVLEFGQRTVADVMIPWASVDAVRADADPQAIWEMADRVPHERLPLLDAAGRPVGTIDIDRVLSCEPGQCPPPAQLADPLIVVHPDLSCRQALARLQHERQTIAVVVAGDRAVGIITPKELIEPIIGELEVW
jgi:putative hemolysin